MNTELVISLAGNRRSRSQWLRYRLSKLYYDKVKFTAQEVEYLFYVIFDLSEAKDQQLEKNMKGRIYILNFLLEFNKRLSDVSEENLKIIKLYCGGIFLTPHEYYGLKFGNLDLDSKPISELFSVKRKEKCRYPEQRRIGVGYRDKGSAQNTALDGTMSWEYYSTLTDEEQSDNFSLSNLLYRGAELQSEYDNEIEDFFHEF